jgi:hypothetical protein
MIGNVNIVSLFMKISAPMNSFQDVMKEKSATVTIPGLTDGRKIRHGICVESGFAEEVFIPQKHGYVRRARYAVEPVLIGGELDMRWTHFADIRITLHFVGDVGHEARLHEIRHENEIDRQDVGYIARGGAVANFVTICGLGITVNSILLS